MALKVKTGLLNRLIQSGKWLYFNPQNHPQVINTKTETGIDKLAFFFLGYLWWAKWLEDYNILTVVCESSNTARIGVNHFIEQVICNFALLIDDDAVHVRAEHHINTRDQLEIDFIFYRNE